MKIAGRLLGITAAAFLSSAAMAETPEQWVALGARVHGGFGSFIPVGIKIGLDAAERLKAKPRELVVTYYDNDRSPCACFADGVAIATVSSFGQRTLKLSEQKAPPEAAAVIEVRPRSGGAGLRYVIPMAALPQLQEMNKTLDPLARYHAVMKADGLFQRSEMP